MDYGLWTMDYGYREGFDQRGRWWYFWSVVWKILEEDKVGFFSIFFLISKKIIC